MGGWERVLAAGQPSESRQRRRPLPMATFVLAGLLLLQIPIAIAESRLAAEVEAARRSLEKSMKESRQAATTEAPPSDTVQIIRALDGPDAEAGEAAAKGPAQAPPRPVPQGPGRSKRDQETEQTILSHISKYSFDPLADEMTTEDPYAGWDFASRASFPTEGPFVYHDPAFCHFNGRRSSHDLEWMESADNLLPIIRDKKRYNMFLAPGQTRGQTTTVSVALYIESMSSFKAQTMDFEVDMYLAMSWFDHRLAHNCSHPVLIAQKGLADRIWHPDLYFVNSKFAYLQEVTTPNFMLLVYPDGFVFKSMRVDVTLSCMMDLARYPMDSQTCPIYIQSYAYIESVLNLTWHVDAALGFPIGYNPSIVLNDMKIMEQDWDWCGGPYPMFRGTGNWSCLKASLRMKRLVMFHIIQTYIPTGMLVMISWLSFWLDPRAGPARISLTITTLLTLTTMSNSARQDLPQVSYIKALDIWLSVCTAFVFCVLLEYTLVSCFVSMRTSHCEHIRIVRKLTTSVETPLLNAAKATAGAGGGAENSTGGATAHPRRGDQLNIKSCGFCAHKWEKTAKKIDKLSRAGFPLLFAIFTLIYWLSYNMHLL